MKKILFAVFCLFVGNVALSCTIHETIIVKAEHADRIAFLRKGRIKRKFSMSGDDFVNIDIPKYYGPGSCGGPSEKQLREAHIRNELESIRRREKAGFNMTAEKARLLEFISQQ